MPGQRRQHYHACFRRSLFGQDSHFEHITLVCTKSGDGLTVKDEVIGLSWQKTYENQLSVVCITGQFFRQRCKQESSF
jgi:hypothetical protein